jgi:cytochrome d ubiquinol oxidase subunit II
VPLLVAAIAAAFHRSIAARRQALPFVMTALLFLVCYCGIAVSVYPFVVPRAITVWDAAAPDESLRFLLVGAVVLLPLILAYTAYSYWVFRGKTGNSALYRH